MARRDEDALLDEEMDRVARVRLRNPEIHAFMSMQWYNVLECKRRKYTATLTARCCKLRLLRNVNSCGVALAWV